MSDDVSTVDNSPKRFVSILSALRSVLVAINSAEQLDDVLTLVCKAAVELLDVQHSGVALFDPAYTQGQVVSEFPPDAGLLRMVFPLKDVPFEEELIRTGQIVSIPDLFEATTLGEAQVTLLNFGVRSMLIVPIFLDDQVIGSFGLDAIGELRTFSTLEKEICLSLVDQVAVAISERRKRAFLQSLFDTSDSFTKPDQPNEVVRGILEAACSTVWASFAVMAVRAGKGLVVRAQSSGLNHPIDSIRPDGISWQVMRSGQATFINDTSTRVDIHPGILRDAVAAAACLPLIADEEPFGVIWIHFAERHTFSDAEKNTLRLFAHQAALAYDKSLQLQRSEAMREAARALAGETESAAVLKQIVINARRVMNSDCAVLWPYDADRDIFFPEGLNADGVSADWLERYRLEDPTSGQISRRVLLDGYIEIVDLEGQKAEVRPSARMLLQEIGVQAFQGVRLSVANQLLGVLFVDYKSLREFTADEKSDLEDYANHAALALYKARLMEQVTRKRETAHVVARVSTLGNLTDTLQAIVDGARQVLRCDIATVYAYDEGREKFVAATGAGCADAENMCPPNRVKKSARLWAVLNLDAEKTFLVEDIAHEPKMRASRFVQKEKIQAALGISLWFKSRPVGVMFIDYRNKHRFSTIEIEDAKLFAHQAAMAIWNALLYEKIRLREEMLHAVFISSKAISSSFELKPTLEELARQALQVLNANESSTGCFSYVVIHESGKIKVAAANSKSIFDKLTDEIGDLKVSDEHQAGIVGRSIRQHKLQNVGNVKVDEDYIEIDPSIHSELCVPLRHAGHIIGSFCIEHPDPDAFDAQRCDALTLLSAQAEIAIHNAQRHDDLRQLKGLIGSRSAVEWMRMVSLAWAHAIQRETFIATNYVELIRPTIALYGTVKDCEDLDNLDGVVQRIQSTLIVAPLGSDEQVDSIQIDEVIGKLLGQLQLRSSYQSVRIVYAPANPGEGDHNHITVRASPQWVSRAVEVLIDNAVAELQSSNVPVKQVVVATSVDGDIAYIRVTDNGRGISHQMLQQLGNSPVEKLRGGSGAGIGLVLARTILNAYGGDWVCERTNDEGTTMTLWLPVENAL